MERLASAPHNQTLQGAPMFTICASASLGSKQEKRNSTGFFRPAR